MAEQSYGDWIRSNPPLPTKRYKKEHMAQVTDHIGDANKMVTAVEWLFEQSQLPLAIRPMPLESHMKAKWREKEQIISAYKADRYPCSYEDAEEYYNKTYKQNT